MDSELPVYWDESCDVGRSSAMPGAITVPAGEEVAVCIGVRRAQIDPEVSDVNEKESLVLSDGEGTAISVPIRV